MSAMLLSGALALAALASGGSANAQEATGADGGKPAKSVTDSKLLGDATSDLVYVPVAPCRVIDTRNAVGAYAVEQVRSYSLGGRADHTVYGGVNTTCNLPAYFGSDTEPAALNLNITIVTTSAAGFFTVYPAGTVRPLSSIINWDSNGQVIANAATVTTAHFVGNDVSFYASNTSHLIVDVLGYYIAPEPTPIDVVEVASTGVDIGAGSSGVQTTPACPAGYKILSAGATSSSFEGRIVSVRTFTGSNWAFAAFRNEGVGTATFIAYGVCGRSAGRVRA